MPTESRWKKLGWTFVPELECAGLSSWADITTLAVQEGFAVHRSYNWLVQPIALRNAAVILVDDSFRKAVEKCMSKEQRGSLFRKFPLNGGSRKITNMEEHPYFYQSDACNLYMDNLVKFELPGGLQFTSSDAILTHGRWFTKGHIEEGGDDSVSVTPVGKNSLR